VKDFSFIPAKLQIYFSSAAGLLRGVTSDCCKGVIDGAPLIPGATDCARH
jgi:hypothetical protein